MSDIKLHMPPEAYKDFREKQSAKALARQSRAFAARVLNKSKHNHWDAADLSRFANPDLKRPAPASTWSLPDQNLFFVCTAPYTSGAPYPEQADHTVGSGVGFYVNREALGDNKTGHFSVGVSGGIWRNADWTGATYYNDLPDRWMLGDAIQCSSSITQVVDLPPNLKPGSVLVVNAELIWDPKYPGSGGPPWGPGLLYDAIALTPGLSNSTGNGFVGVTAMAVMTVTLPTDDGPYLLGDAYDNFLNVGVNAKNYGNGVQDQAPAPFLFLDYEFLQNPSLTLGVAGAYGFGATQMLVEISIRFAGCRAGVNDPNAGSVIGAFQNVYNPASPSHVSPVNFLPSYPNPFLLNRILGYILTN